MSWAALFAGINTAALVAWAVLILVPGRSRSVAAIRFGVVGALCVIYVALVATALGGGFAPRPGPAVDFTTIEGVRAIFASDGGVVAGWTHYLAFDLFVGCWIADDADRRGIGQIAQAPVLALTFVAGPAGLLLHYTLRLFIRDKGQARPPR